MRKRLLPFLLAPFLALPLFAQTATPPAPTASPTTDGTTTASAPKETAPAGTTPAAPAPAADAGVATPKAPRAPKPPPPGVSTESDVVMGNGGGRPLRAEIAYPTEKAASPLPAVIFIHGGGWEGGNNKGREHMRLATMGYFGANVEYRLTGEAKWPAQIEDVKLAVRWLRANAAKYNIDPNRIGVWGVSAGGHLVTCLGTMGDMKELEGKGGYPEVSSKVQCVVNFCGPVDFLPREGEKFATEEGAEHPLLVKLFGFKYADRPDLWKQGSPIEFVKAGDPPFLIVHGDKDETVPYSQAVKLDAALRKVGVPVEFITVKNGNHGMSAPKGEPAATPKMSDIQLSVLNFLDRNLKAASPTAAVTPTKAAPQN